MSISARLAVFSVILTATTIVICCALLLITAANSQVDSAIHNGVAELRMLNNSFTAEMNVVGDENLSDTAKRSLILFVFRKYTDASVSGSHYILTDMQAPLYNDCPIDPQPLLPQLEEAAQWRDDAARFPYTIAELNGRRYLIAGHWEASIGSKMSLEHEIFLVRDITAVYDGITALGLQFAGIALLTVLLSAVIMVVFIRRALRPLGELQKNAAALADGQYDNRIRVQGRNEITALAVSFNKMADAVARHIAALEDTAAQRKLLLSALTHELKTPMTAIIGYSEALMRVRLSPRQKENSIAYIHSECSRIERLSQKMMKLVTLHGGEPANIQARPVKHLFDTVDMTLQRIAQKENIELVMTEKDEPVFEMDTDMMASVLINLFDNARKAGARHITIDARDHAISVRDDGKGIPADEIQKVTQPFYMVDKSHSQSDGGSGLGLALCELIIKAHHAQLKIESQLGEGTVITIIFEQLHFDNITKNT